MAYTSSVCRRLVNQTVVRVTGFFFSAGLYNRRENRSRCNNRSRSSFCGSDHRFLLRCSRTVNFLLLGAGRTGGRWRGEITLAFIVALPSWMRRSSRHLVINVVR
jgi:hypothetical protein